MGPFFRHAQGKLFRETKSKLFNKLNKSNLINLKLTKKQIVNQDLNRGILLMRGSKTPLIPYGVGATLACLRVAASAEAGRPSDGAAEAYPTLYKSP